MKGTGFSPYIAEQKQWALATEGCVSGRESAECGSFLGVTALMLCIRARLFSAVEAERELDWKSLRENWDLQIWPRKDG
jgi:hypothetical protein